MKILIYSIVVLFNFFFLTGQLSAKQITVYVINFSNVEIEDLVIRDISKKENDNSADIIGIMDAEHASFVSYYNKSHPEYGKRNILPFLKETTSSKFYSNPNARINLPFVLSKANEFILSHYIKSDKVEVLLVDVLEHSGRNFSFKDGFPNDGFLTLSDSDFSLIRKLDSDIQVDVKVVENKKSDFRSQYEKFAFHLSDKIFGGTLNSFSFGKSAQTLNFDEPISSNIADLKTVQMSQVINSEKRPVCEVEDFVNIVQKTNQLAINIKNLSRANSVGNFKLILGENINSGQFSFNEEGIANFEILKFPGQARLEISDCLGIFVERGKYSSNELSDIIKVTNVSESIALIEGENLQRVDGSDVVIIDEKTNREWIVQANGGKYSIEVPLSPGEHKFFVKKPFSNEKQYFNIKLQEDCRLNSDVTYNGAIGSLVVNSSCTINEELQLTYNNKNYSNTFNDQQTASVEFPLICGTHQGSWIVDAGERNEFLTQYAIRPDIITVSELSSVIKIDIENSSRAGGSAKYNITVLEEVLEGNVEFDTSGKVSIEIPRDKVGAGVFQIENCQGELSNSASFEVTAIDDKITTSILSNEKANIHGKNIQRRDGSSVLLTNTNTNETWEVVVENGEYKIDINVPPGEQNFTATKPDGNGVYDFKVKVRDECKLTDKVSFDGGLALLSITSDCSNSDLVKVDYNSRVYEKSFPSSGIVTFKLPMECGESSGIWSAGSFDNRKFLTSFDCTGIFRVILTWEQNVDLDLHVAETTNAKIKEANWIYHQNCKGQNSTKCKGIGFLNKDCEKDGCGSLKEEYYEGDLLELREVTNFVTAMVHFYNRDKTKTYAESETIIPKSDYCGSAPNAIVKYKIVAYVENRRVERRGVTEHKKTIKSLPCGVERQTTAFVNENELAIPLN
jgi:hypothetical protein